MLTGKIQVMGVRMSSKSRGHMLNPVTRRINHCMPHLLLKFFLFILKLQLVLLKIIDIYLESYVEEGSNKNVSKTLFQQKNLYSKELFCFQSTM